MIHIKDLSGIRFFWGDKDGFFSNFFISKEERARDEIFERIKKY